MTTKPDCKLCNWGSGGPSGGWYLQNEHWSIGAYPSFDVPGWVVMQLRRHAPGLTDLTSEELTSLGPTLQKVASAIEAVLHPERVYFVSFNEDSQHVHIVLIPRTQNVGPDRRSAALHVNRKEFSDPPEASRVGLLIREALNHEVA